MTFAIGHVSGGTGAGRKIQKPAPEEWHCECAAERFDDNYAAVYTFDNEFVGLYRVQPAYMVRCTDCGTRRDG